MLLKVPIRTKSFFNDQKYNKGVHMYFTFSEVPMITAIQISFSVFYKVSFFYLKSPEFFYSTAQG